MAQCITFQWTMIWSQYLTLRIMSPPLHHTLDSGDPANMGITLSLIPLLSIGGPANTSVTIFFIPILIVMTLLTWVLSYHSFARMQLTLLMWALRHPYTQYWI